MTDAIRSNDGIPCTWTCPSCFQLVAMTSAIGGSALHTAARLPAGMLPQVRRGTAPDGLPRWGVPNRIREGRPARRSVNALRTNAATDLAHREPGGTDWGAIGDEAFWTWCDRCGRALRVVVVA